MPLYEHECVKCKLLVETLMSLNDSREVFCEKCGAKMRKLISKTSFSLSGSCWAKDGYSK